MSANEILEMLISEKIKISQALQYTRLLLLKSNSIAHLDWVASECNGYNSKLEIPDYRKIPCGLYAQVSVPLRGVIEQPVMAKELDEWLGGDEKNVSINTMCLVESFENLERMIDNSNQGNNYIRMEFPVSIQNWLIKATSGPGDILNIYQQTNISYLNGVISSVKTTLINILIQFVQEQNSMLDTSKLNTEILLDTEYKSVFISYSYDNHSHEQWVKHFADTLKAYGVKTIFDKDLPYGSDLSSFMVKGIQDADVVLVVGTPTYLQKTQQSETTGVRFEDVIITNSLMANIDANKFIPILRQGTYSSSFPLLLSHRKGIDFSDDSKFDEKIKELLQALMIINP